MFLNIFVLLLSVFTAECTKDAYEYVPSVGRLLKLHTLAATWPEARLKCHLEGGFLASPDNRDMLAAMNKINKDQGNDSYIYTGIHATYAKGAYTTITGTPLSSFNVEWAPGEPNNLDNDEDCLVMSSSGALADKRCTVKYPFICYKSSADHPCSHDYVLYNETGSCYKFHKEGCSWPDAFKSCLAEGAYLAIINSVQESNVIKELFSQNPAPSIPGTIFKETASIGFTKLDENQEFFTIHGQSLTEAGFAVFHEGEPNNLYNNEKCGSVFRDGLLNDHSCDESITFICEKPIVSNF